MEKEKEIQASNLSSNEENKEKKLSEKEKNSTIKSMIEENKKLIEENKKLIEENEKLIEENAKFKDNWYRTAADFENFKKRNRDTRIIAYKEGKIDIISKILVFGDSLDRAIFMDLDEKTKEGVELILRGFLETLNSEGISVINPIGEKFDPNEQEAIMQVPKEEGETEGTVKQVFEKGYKLGDKIIRYAKVVVIGN